MSCNAHEMHSPSLEIAKPNNHMCSVYLTLIESATALHARQPAEQQLAAACAGSHYCLCR